MIYIKLFFVFFKIGLFSIGGGLATIPFLQELIDSYGWITSQELLDIIAISESTPGPIGINAATYVGYKTAGIFGGIIATIGIVVPSIIIITLIATYFEKVNERPIVQNGFYTLRPAVIGLIGAAGYEVFKIALFNIDIFSQTHDFLSLFNIKAIILFVIILIFMKKVKLHPVAYIGLAALVGIIFKY